MKIFNLLRSEFVKNYSLKRFLLVFLILFISSFFLVNMNSDGDNRFTLQESIDMFSMYLEKKEKIENKNFHDYFSYEYNKNYVEYMSMLLEMGVKSSNDYRINLVYDDLLPLIMQNYVISKMKANIDDDYIELACKSDDINYDSHNNDKTIINDLCNNYSEVERDSLYIKNNKRIDDYKELLNNGKYYLYLDYQVKCGKIEDDYVVRLLISKKIKRSDTFLGLNYLQYKQLEENTNINIMSQDEYEKSKYTDSSYDTYKGHLEYLKNNAIKNRELLLYSIKSEIKHDISYSYNDNVRELALYNNTKLHVNKVFHLSIVVIFILCISSGKIVSGEHSNGTIKNIITAPVRRWKILLSKFIYMIIDFYFLWFLGLIIISVIAGIKYGFSDLITPKLIYSGGSVIEVNYYLYLIKDMLIASIPAISFISIIFFLSTVTLNTSLTVGVTSMLATLSICLWLMSATGNIKEIVYTPLWYLDLGFIFNNSSLYVESLRNVSYDLNIGLIVSFVCIIVFYIASNIVYIKRDIKN